MNMMSTQNFKFKIVLVILASSLFFLLPRTAHAASGISVTPSIIHIDLASDPPEYTLAYTNNTKTQITLKLSAADFTELEDNYKISFLTGKDASNYKYGLSSWISFENSQIELNPGEKKSVKVFIDKNRITKGGHYASILAEIEQPESKNQIALKAMLSSLLFVRAATGKEIEEGKISDFTPLRDGIDYPDEYSVSFENSGNVHVIPYGLIAVFDPLGNLVAKGEFNFNSLDALPESIRRYDTKVNALQKLLLPGVYTAKVDLHFGKTNQKASAEVKFFSQGGFNFVKIAVALVILLLIVLYLRKRLKTKPA